MNSSRFLSVCSAGIIFATSALLQAQLIDVDFNNDSAGSAHGGPSIGPTMSGAAVLGSAGDQWNGINVNSGSGVSLIYSSGAPSPVTMTFTSGGGYDANAYGGSTPFAGAPYDALMEDYIFNGGVAQTITFPGLYELPTTIWFFIMQQMVPPPVAKLYLLSMATHRAASGMARAQP